MRIYAKFMREIYVGTFNLNSITINYFYTAFSMT